MRLNNIADEFKQLIEIAEDVLLDPRTAELTMDQFLQLCIDIRNSERDNNIVDLSNKNVVILDKDIIQ